MTLDTIVLIAEIILFAALTVLAVYLIVTLKKLTAAVDKVQKDVEQIQQKVEPVLMNAQLISGNVVEITSIVKSQIAKVDSIVDSVKERSDSIIEFEKNTQMEVEKQVYNVLNLVSAVNTGIRTFFAALSGSKKNLPGKHKSHSTISEDASYEDL